MSNRLKDLSEQMALYADSPNAMMKVVLDELENGGFSLTNPADPLLFAIESSIMSGHALMQSVSNTLPRIFPSMALTHKDIFRHISDKDAMNIYAQPSATTFTFVFDLSELRKLAVPVPGTSISKVVIPVSTEYYAKDLQFSQPYPLEIRFMQHDGIQVRWDSDYDNPFTFIPSGIVEHQIATIMYGGKQLETLRIPVTTEQYKTRYQSSQTIPNILWKSTYTLTDKFYSARVMHKLNGTIWVPLKTALVSDVIDPLTPTVVCTVNGKIVTLEIPEVYINTGQVSGEITIEILETKGVMTQSFSNYYTDDFSYKFKDNTNYTPTQYTNVLKKLQLITLYNDTVVSGGRDELEFIDLRERVINNTIGEVKQPISDMELEASLVDSGYSIYKAVDTISSRIYLAGLSLPKSDIATISSAIGCTNDNVILTFDQLNNHPAIRANGNRYTLTTDCIFNTFGNTTRLVNEQTLKTIKWLSNVDKIDYFASNQILSLPYHVVVDINSHVVESRIYALSKPKMVSRQLESTNDALVLTVNTKSSQLTMTEYGYKYRCLTKSNDAYKETDANRLDAYLSFMSSTGRAYKRGTLVGTIEGEFYWEWEIESNLDIDRNDNMLIDGFKSGEVSYTMAVALEAEFSVVYSVVGTFAPELKTEADGKLPQGYIGLAITDESHRLKLGESLNNMWVYSRPVPGTLQYETYEEDIPCTYPEDVPVNDGRGGWKYTIIDGKIVFDKAHSAGDPIYEKDGSIRIRHHKGTTVYQDGTPVIKEKAKLEIDIDLWLVDARFKVTTDVKVSEYNDFWFDYIISNSKDIIPKISKNTLDRTTISLTAENTISNVKVMLANEVTTLVPAEQRFAVKYYVTSEVRQDQDKLRQIKNITNRVISETLKGSRIISTSILSGALHTALVDYIDGVLVNPFEMANGTSYMSILDPNASIGIAKRLMLTKDNNLSIEDDVSISYLKSKTK